MNTLAQVPTLSISLTAIDIAPLATSTRDKYRREVEKFIASGGDIRDPAGLAEYAATLPASGRAFLKAGIRLLSAGAAIAAKSAASPDNINVVQAALYRIEAIQEAIHVKAVTGVKAHTWLSQAEVKELMATCDDTIEGKRDWIVLALLVGAGVRRDELTGLTFEDVTDVPTKNGRKRAVLAVTGKGAKSRVIPLNALLAQRIREWAANGPGKIALSLGRKKELGESLSGVGVFDIVRKHGAMIGLPELAPHDLRRTYAQLGYDAGVPITQISVLLGHATVATTQRYLNLALNLDVTASDFIPLE